MSTSHPDNSRSQSPKGWELGRLVPALLVLALLSDLAFRALSLNQLAFRAWEVMWIGAAPDRGPFMPSARYDNPTSYGELAAVGNLPDLRVPHAEIFTTDALGYRNTESTEPVTGVLFGTSFSVGSGVSDHETLSAQLGERTGRRIYNAAGPGFSPRRLRVLKESLGIEKGYAIFEVLERKVFPDPSGRGEELEAASDPLVRLRELLLAFRVSPLKIMVERSWKLLLNDRVLPNVLAKRVAVRTLRNGRSMIFRGEDFSDAREMGDPKSTLRYIDWLNAEVRKEGLELVVILVPEKASVYSPSLESPQVSPAVEYFKALENALQGARVPVVNLLPVLSSSAAAALDRGEYLYYPDDTHWNGEGIGVAADAIAPLLPHIAR